MNSGAFFLRSVGLAGLILTRSMLPSSTPPTRDTRHFCTLPCFLLQYHPRRHTRNVTNPPSIQKLNLLLSIYLWIAVNTANWEVTECETGVSAKHRHDIAVHLVLHITLHVHPQSKSFITYRDDIITHKKECTLITNECLLRLTKNNLGFYQILSSPPKHYFYKVLCSTLVLTWHSLIKMY